MSGGDRSCLCCCLETPHQHTRAQPTPTTLPPTPLPPQTGPVSIDEALLRRLHAKAVAAAQREAEAEADAGGGAAGGGGLDADEVAAYKRRAADLMAPGETVLAALRRLGERGGRGDRWLCACRLQSCGWLLRWMGVL